MICSRASASHTELQVEIPTLFEVIKHPIVSVGVLRWVEHTLTDPAFFEVAAENSSLFLVLLNEVQGNKLCINTKKIDVKKIVSLVPDCSLSYTTTLVHSRIA